MDKTPLFGQRIASIADVWDRARPRQARASAGAALSPRARVLGIVIASALGFGLGSMVGMYGLARGDTAVAAGGIGLASFVVGYWLS